MSSHGEQNARYLREAEFHDAIVATIDATMPPVPADPWVRAMLDQAGPLQTKRVLEFGCGSGDLAIQLASAGAILTVLDISPRSVEITCERVAHFVEGASVIGVVAPAEATGLPGEGFDLIIGSRVIHHLDVEIVAAEIARLLAPSGQALFVENSGLNPVLRLARRWAAGRFGIPRLGTEDEHPLVQADFDHFRHHFRRVELLFPVFRFLGLFDRQVLRYRFPVASRICTWLDAMADRHLPWLRPYGYLVLIKAAAPYASRTTGDHTQ
jgi:SAM-dependent methyltransferase